MIKVEKGKKDTLRKGYEISCMGYLVELLGMWEYDPIYGFWVSDEIGGTYCYGDDIFLNMDEIIYCVENDITEKEYREYLDYNTQALSFNFKQISLPAWHKGAPRVSQAVFDKLSGLKSDLEKLVEEEKERIKEQELY